MEYQKLLIHIIILKLTWNFIILIIKMLARISKRLLHINQSIPHLKLVVCSGNEGKYNIERDIDSETYFANKKVVLIGFPGAYTPTCTGTHIPQFVKLQENFDQKGVELIGLAVNDPFVLKEFGQDMGGKIAYIADGSGYFTRALDAGLDLTEKGLGYRTRRFTALVENGVITQVNDENGGQLTAISSAETILKSI
ncbi:unnamed protein product [Blepharisma stoltei]|uniref:Thioredoxin domain-containing protein n=1 Tax=Blepharisma stoltei TaxID=1481888 RepID=A0AAU9JTL5_9CILI|nr:unnamed protein product [Blepharisma stoltei]